MNPRFGHICGVFVLQSVLSRLVCEYIEAEGSPWNRVVKVFNINGCWIWIAMGLSDGYVACYGFEVENPHKTKTC